MKRRVNNPPYLAPGRFAPIGFMISSLRRVPLGLRPGVSGSHGDISLPFSSRCRWLSVALLWASARQHETTSDRMSAAPRLPNVPGEPVNRITRPEPRDSDVSLPIQAPPKERMPKGGNVLGGGSAQPLAPSPSIENRQAVQLERQRSDERSPRNTRDTEQGRVAPLRSLTSSHCTVRVASELLRLVYPSRPLVIAQLLRPRSRQDVTGRQSVPGFARAEVPGEFRSPSEPIGPARSGATLAFQVAAFCNGDYSPGLAIRSTPPASNGRTLTEQIVRGTDHNTPAVGSRLDHHIVTTYRHSLSREITRLLTEFSRVIDERIEAGTQSRPSTSAPLSQPLRPLLSEDVYQLSRQEQRERAFRLGQ
jgi:hypothetical protein